LAAGRKGQRVVESLSIIPGSFCSNGTGTAAAISSEKMSASLTVGGRRGTEALHGVALLAARYIAGIVKEGSILGMSWGRMVYQTVQLLQPERELSIKVVQLFGAAIPNNKSMVPHWFANLPENTKVSIFPCMRRFLSKASL